MCKIIIAVVLMAVAVYSQGAVGSQTPEQSKADLVKAGLSDGAAAGIVDISNKYMSQLANMKTDIDNFMLTQSAADQQAYKAYTDKVTAHILDAAKSGFQ